MASFFSENPSGHLPQQKLFLRITTHRQMTNTIYLPMDMVIDYRRKEDPRPYPPVEKKRVIRLATAIYLEPQNLHNFIKVFSGEAELHYKEKSRSAFTHTFWFDSAASHSNIQSFFPNIGDDWQPKCFIYSVDKVVKNAKLGNLLLRYIQPGQANVYLEINIHLEIERGSKKSNSVDDDVINYRQKSMPNIARGYLENKLLIDRLCRLNPFYVDDSCVNIQQVIAKTDSQNWRRQAVELDTEVPENKPEAWALYFMPHTDPINIKTFIFLARGQFYQFSHLLSPDQSDVRIAFQNLIAPLENTRLKLAEYREEWRRNRYEHAPRDRRIQASAEQIQRDILRVTTFLKDIRDKVAKLHTAAPRAEPTSVTPPLPSPQSGSPPGELPVAFRPQSAPPLNEPLPNISHFFNAATSSNTVSLRPQSRFRPPVTQSHKK